VAYCCASQLGRSNCADPMPEHDSPGRVIGGLDDIANDMAERMNPFEDAASRRARLTRDWDHRMAVCIRQATGPNAEVRKANALVRAIEMDDLYQQLTDAESDFEAQRVVLKVLSDRSMIGMAILRAQGRG
jgi:hypothetical protein